MPVDVEFYQTRTWEGKIMDYPTLGEAISATQPSWLLAYLTVLVAANLGAVFFIAEKTPPYTFDR